jgi:integrase
MKRFLDSAVNFQFYPLLVLPRQRVAVVAYLARDEVAGETRGGLRLKSTKSGEPREFAVPAVALTVLDQHREQQELDRAMYGTAYEEHRLIFRRPDSAYYRPDQMSVRVTEFARKNGFPGIGLHSLRHYAASRTMPRAFMAKRPKARRTRSSSRPHR